MDFVLGIIFGTKELAKDTITYSLAIFIILPSILIIFLPVSRWREKITLSRFLIVFFGSVVVILILVNFVAKFFFSIVILFFVFVIPYLYNP